MKRQLRSHRIPAQDPPRVAPRLTPAEVQDVHRWLAAGYTDIEVTRAAFRAWGRDVSPSTIRTRRLRGETA